MRVARCIGLALVACGVLFAAPLAQAHRSRYGKVSIRRTEHGIPHIRASNYLGLGYGFGYAFAQDDLCTMAEDYVTVDAQRSRFFGPGASYIQRGAGVTTNNLDSDIFWQRVKDSGIVGRLARRRGAVWLNDDIRHDIRGYVAGYNHYLRSVGGRRGVPDPTCRGKAWVRPISLATAYRRLYQLTLLASGDVVIPGIAAAKPPAAGATAASASGVDPAAFVSGLRRHPLTAAGSNAVAVGRAGTHDHRHGLLLGNPHFPWIGPERFYQAQLTIPGKLDVTGATLFGVPVVLIGHTRSLAWSHTVSTAFRFTPYELKLAPGSPTSYLLDGHRVAMTHHVVRVRVRTAGGKLKTVRHTLYGTRWGPVFDNLEGESLPWTTSSAFAFADANRTNFRIFRHFAEVDRAQSVKRLLAILRHVEGLPWVNTIAADRGGHALYADIGTIPHVTDAEAKRCDTPIGQVAFSQLGLPILDGSRSSCRWGSDAGAATRGILGARHLPALQRSDYVTNSNDSYWLANPHHPLEGFARIIGDERTPRSLRTRSGLIMTQRIVDHGGFTRARMQRMVFSDHQYAGQLTRGAWVNLCRSFPGGMAPRSSGAAVPVGDACDVLAHWDLHENLHSRGAVLFARVLANSSLGSSSFFAHPLSLADPVHTPNTLNTADPLNRTALGDAIADLRGAHVGLDASPGDVQRRAGIPIHGGPGDPNGEFNAIYAPFTPGKGFSPVQEGSSFVQVVTWNKRPCPNAATILTYSESANPRSPFYSDQTRLFSHKRWVTDHFCAADVRRHTRSITRLGG